MQYPLEEQWHGEGKHRFRVLVPQAAYVQQTFRTTPMDENRSFPYWARLWPAAVALADFIVEQPGLVQDKKLLELAAGLGLPSLQASWFASQVICSDKEIDAVNVIQQSVAANGFKNIKVQQIDWNHIPDDMQPDLVLLSDINYEASMFTDLYSMLMKFRQRQVAILLSTPHRLMAKPFIEKLLPYCRQHLVRPAMGEDISILLL